MKRKPIMFSILLMMLCAVMIAGAFAQESGETQNVSDELEQIFPAEFPGDPSYNTGESHLSVLKASGNNMITSFRFEKGAHNYWHSHPDAE